MAHEITTRDSLFTVRQPSWHGLESAVFDDYPTREEAQQVAHPWEPVTEPLFRRVPVVAEDGSLTHDFEEVADFQGTARSDNGDLLGVVGEGYEPVNNAEMYDIAEAIEGEAKGSVRFETGGSLKGGRKVWLLIRLQDPLTINGDPNGATIPYFALQNAHDGSGAFRGQATMTRIVCDNTAQMADLDAKQRGTEFSFRHTRNVGDRIEQAKMALAGWQDSVRDYQLMMDVLTNTPIFDWQAVQFVEQLIPMPPAGTASDRVRSNVNDGRDKWWEILRSETCEGVDHRASGLVHATVEYLNHARRAHSQESLFKRNYLDRNQVTAHAVNMVRELVSV